METPSWHVGRRGLRLIAGAAIALGPGSPAAAQSRFIRPITLSEAEEVALALSAAPGGVADSAAVYVLRPTGYVVVREGSNGFSCLVEHEDPKAIEPVCYDAEGSATLLPVALFRQQRRAAGEDDSAIAAEIDRGFQSGQFRVPRKTGVAYMLSPRASIPPHVMIYAPYATRRDLGLPGPGLGGGLPVLYNEGKPNAYIIIMAPQRNR